MIKLDEYSAKEISDLVNKGEISATEVTNEALSLIEKRDKTTHAYLEVTSDLALKQAELVDKKRTEGNNNLPLAGVPVAFKDNMQLKGAHMTAASKILEGYESTFNAACVERMLGAGAIPLGKVNLDEFAFGSSTETSAYGPTFNPWNNKTVPGGSSGGSAAAVADGTALIAMGSDTGGSIRQPASFCGVVGYKPTLGVSSRHGTVEFAGSLDVVGPLAKNVEDIALVMDLLVGKDERDVACQDFPAGFTNAISNLSPEGVKDLTIGVVPSVFEFKGLSPEVVSAVQEAVSYFKGLGCNIAEVEFDSFADTLELYRILGTAEAFSALSRFDGVRYAAAGGSFDNVDELMLDTRTQGFGAEVKKRIMLGAYVLSSKGYEKYYVPAQRIRTRMLDEVDEIFESIDIMLTPTSTDVAFEFDSYQDPQEMFLSDCLTAWINIAGTCAIHVPTKLSAQGMPLGVQLIAKQFDDIKLMKAARVLESEYKFKSNCHIA